MFERILYFVSEKQDDKHLVMELARSNGSTVFLSGIMDPECHHEVLADGNTRPEARREDSERKCWQDIYRLEEELKKAGVKSSVIAQEGKVENIQKLASSTHCDLIVLSAASLEDSDYQLPEDLLAELPCPLLLTN
ncbi:hypothetical protein JXB37_00175 [candidate division WOR-3 bacterium]|nr:hypothetical protein [candidate division WOR-3 bacterium]